MSGPFIFFDLGQTLVNEWDFIAHFEQKLLELLSGYGVRIDKRNYRAIRDSIIRDRKIGYGSVRELAIRVCEVLLPRGYEISVWNNLYGQIRQSRRELFLLFDDAMPTVRALSTCCEMGLIANQTEDIQELLENSGIAKFFKVKSISSLVKIEKPDLKIFELALKEAGRPAKDCIMVGDRLDTDMCPANTLDMTTIRVTDSLFALQSPALQCEQPTYTVAHLSEIPVIVERIMNIQI